MSTKHSWPVMLQALLLAAALGLTACGGSSTSTPSSTTGDTGTTGSASTDCTQPTSSDTKGCTYVNLTDAPGDFLTYTVTVTALTLQRSDGTSVSVLPAATSVDFAQYSDLSEFLTLATMPLGTYTGGSITLDYSGANIQVQDASGNAVQVAPVDANGNPLTTLTLNIELDSTGELTLVPGVPRVFQVDFNLSASNAVNLSNDTVTVQPFLVASVDPDLTNQVAVRGPLAAVDTASSSFTLGLRPFYAGSGNYGNMGIVTGTATVYHINQTAYTGSAGLAALAAAGATTAVVAKGTFSFSSHSFQAAEVDAGSSVPGGTLDVADGVVLSRSGNNLVLRGATLYRTGQTATFADSVSVTLASGTVVHQEGTGVALAGIGDISVGQRLMVFGTLTDSSPSALTLDASSGYALMEYTRLDGTVSGVSGADLTLDLQYIEGRPVSMFSFTGTGSGSDAVPTAYSVAFNSAVSGVNSGDPVRVWGFVTPFGSAPPDFDGTSVADYAAAGTDLLEVWSSPGSANGFTSMSPSSGLVLNLAATPTALIAGLEQGGIAAPLTSLTSAPTLQAGIGIFAIAQNGSVQVHLTLAGFLTDLTTRLNAGAKLRVVFARGGFASSSDILSAADIGVVLQ